MSCFGVTGDLDELKFEWKISIFFSLSETKGSSYISPSFVFANISLHLEIFPSGTSKAKSGFLSLYLVNEDETPFHLKMTLCIKKADGTRIESKTANPYLKTDWGFHSFYEKSSLEQNKSELVPSGILTIVCILKLKQDKKQDTLKAETVPDSQEEQSHNMSNYKRLSELDTLSTNFKDLIANKESCDTTLHVQDKEYKAHRAVLIARSSVFAAMFLHETSEKQTGIVTIPDCDPESFGEFLEFLYSGKFENPSSRNAIYLYETSDKYEVEELKVFCMEYLMQNINVENVCGVAILADKYEEDNLLSAAQVFLHENLDEILDTSEWDSLVKNNFRLSKKLLKGMSSKVKVVE